MSHGIPARGCKSLKQQENVCNILQHATLLACWLNLLKTLAIPAGFEPATHGVEIRYSATDHRLTTETP